MIDYFLFLVFWAFVIGLCIGSFLNVVVLRGLSGESIVFPSSKCPVCGNKLKWWMNIPVLSYILLRGKCGFCKTKISPQYPIVELFTGFTFAFIFYAFGISFETLFFFAAASLIIVMSVCDIKEQVIFDLHAYILVALGLIYNIFAGGFSGLLAGLLGGILGFILYEILARFGQIFAGQRAFGEGDSLIAAGIGAFFGWKLLLISAFLSLIVMAVFTVPYFLIYSYKVGKKRSCAAIITGIFLIILTYLIAKAEILQTYESIIIFLIFALIVTGWCAKQLLTDMHKKNEEGEVSLCMLPFGPAMGVSFFIIMFFAPELETLIKSYLGY